MTIDIFWKVKCDGCGLTVEIDNRDHIKELLEKGWELTEKARDFDVTGESMDFCPDCSGHTYIIERKTMDDYYVR